MLAIGRISPDGLIHTTEFLAIELSPKVPKEIRTMFRTGIATLLYGYFFYPLYAVGLGELSRTAESALAKRFKELGGPRKVGTFHKRLRWMLDNDQFTEPQFQIWDGFRRLRNYASHPEYQRVGPPHEARHTARLIAHAVSCLFDSSLDFESFWQWKSA